MNCKSRRSRHPHGWCTLVMLEVLVLPSTNSDNTNVLVLLSHSEGLGNCFIKKGKSSKSRIAQLSNVVDNLSKNLDRDVRLCDFL